MAAKKETTKKKNTTKKSTGTKKVVAKVAKENENSAIVIPEEILEEQVEKFNEALKNDEVPVVDITHEEVVEDYVIENGDPSVLAPKEEKNTVVKEPVKKENKITKKTSQYFGYYWNGIAIDN